MAAVVLQPHRMELAPMAVAPVNRHRPSALRHRAPHQARLSSSSRDCTRGCSPDIHFKNPLSSVKCLSVRSAAAVQQQLRSNEEKQCKQSEHAGAESRAEKAAAQQRAAQSADRGDQSRESRRSAEQQHRSSQERARRSSRISRRERRQSSERRRIKKSRATQRRSA